MKQKGITTLVSFDHDYDGFPFITREEPAPLEEMDPVTKGGLFHRVQAELQRELKDKGLLPVKVGDLPEALEMLDRTVKRIAEQAYEELAPAITGRLAA